MVLVLIVLFTVSLSLSLLLWRQISLTRRFRKDIDEWKQLYEQVRSERAALLKALRTRERKGDTTPSQSEAQRKSPHLAESKRKTNPSREIIATGVGGQPAKVLEPLTLILPIQLLSKNSRDKLHYQARGKLRKQYREIIELKHPQRALTPQVKQRATVTRIKGPRERDFDEQNIGAGSAIELIDALTAAGYWLDDSPKWLETVFVQSVSGKVKGPAVVVEIRALS